jgi:hypothetical protein
VVPLALARERALLAHLDDDERRSLDALLDKLGRGLDDLARDD